MVTLDTHGRSQHSAARKPHRRPVTDTEILHRARFVSVETCLATCRAEFVASDLRIKPGAAFTDVCSALTSIQPHEVFWRLYCCDSSRCEVHVDRGGPLEQSPNVDLLINQCRDHGFYDIYDPGPPAFTCAKPSSFVLPAQPSPFSSGKVPSFPASTHKESPAPVKSNPPDSATVAALTGPSASSAPAGAAQSIPSSPGGLSQGAKAAVGVCCAVFMVTLLAVLWLIRRRCRSNRGYLKSPPSPRHTRAEPGPQSGFHNPLLTPPPSSSSKTIPVAPPPPRLSDRRYLVSMDLGPYPVQYGRRSSPAPMGFPRAPICAPTGKKLAPRPENPPATLPSGNSTLFDLASNVLPFTGTPREGLTSQDNSTGVSSPATGGKTPRSIDSASLPRTPPSSPSRPKRPHDSLLEVGTVRPASKPPNWVLPAPPRNVRRTQAPAPSAPPVSPPSTAGSTKLPDTSSQATPHPQHSGTVTAAEPEKNPPASRSAWPGPSTDSIEFNESYARKKRDMSVSWGSWGGTGAGGRSRAAEKKLQGASDKKGTGSTAMPLQDLNLEALGGRY